MTTAARFEIEYTRILDESGQVVEELPGFAADTDTLVRMYETMALTRAFDEKAIALQRTGRLGTYASSLGQEAVAVGLAAAMRVDDVLAPSFREHGAQIWRGVTLTELFLFWGGDERGNDFSGPRGDFPACIPVASQFPHAAGAAYAFQLRSEDRCAVVVGGDGSTSKGDFYEALNIAGAWRLPVVFVICDNAWAISVPRAEQSAAETLAQKAIAAGLPGEQVDGNDVLAVRDAVERALFRARAGEGATLIEALTYRLSDHTTADDASRYREPAMVSAHWSAEPLTRLRAYLVAADCWTKADEEALLAETRAEVDAAAAAYLAMQPQAPSTMFDHLYGEIPADLARQRAQAVDEMEATDA